MFQKNKTRRRIKRIALVLFCWLCIHIIYITADGLHNYHGRAGVAVILGNQVFADGSLSPWLKGRVDKALALYKAGKVEKIFASGGTGTRQSNFYPEGDAMKKYLLAKGVPDSVIIADNLGQNTYLTARNFMTWNAEHHYTSVIVVSQFYHITRIKYIFHKLGCTNVYSASSDAYSRNDIVGTLREVPAFYKYLLAY